MNTELINTLLETSEQQEQDIRQIKTTLTSLPDYHPAFQHLEEQLTSLQQVTAKLEIPAKAMLDLRLDLAACRQQLKEIIRVEHHHHVHKLAYIAAGLLLCFVITGWGWWSTHEQLNQYSRHDIQYRYLKLKGAKETAVLFHIDSLYQAAPGRFRDSVYRWEKELEQRVLLEQQISTTEQELKRLRQKR